MVYYIGHLFLVQFDAGGWYNLMYKRFPNDGFVIWPLSRRELESKNKAKSWLQPSVRII